MVTATHQRHFDWWPAIELQPARSTRADPQPSAPGDGRQYLLLPVGGRLVVVPATANPERTPDDEPCD